MSNFLWGLALGVFLGMYTVSEKFRNKVNRAIGNFLKKKPKENPQSKDKE